MGFTSDARLTALAHLVGVRCGTLDGTTRAASGETDYRFRMRAGHTLRQETTAELI